MNSDVSHQMTQDESSASIKLTWMNWSNLVAYVLNFGITYGSLTGIFGATNTVLSKKYQTLVTPAGFAFAIWAPIFLIEGIFAIAQMFPGFRGTEVVRTVTPWWLTACGFQMCWTVAFAQEIIPLSLLCMLGILASLLGLAFMTDRLKLPWDQYLLLRAPFSLHLGWIVAASAVNTNVQADAAMASPEVLLGLAVTSFAVVMALATALAACLRTPDAIVCFVVAWAFNGIRVELGDGQNLDATDRLNPYAWDDVTIGGLQLAAQVLAILALVLVSFAIGRTAFIARQYAKDSMPAVS